ncbi:MAG: AIR synthase-related protein, partial [Halobacteria archaeon]|nr:AIR synthase-related protein [Halobacteria archaeon]
PLPIPPIFDFVKELGDVPEREMYTTFNMGMGFALVLPEDDAEEVENEYDDAEVVGRVEDGEGVRVRGLEL